MKFVLLTSVDNADIERVQSAYNHSSISRFMHIDKENYWSYVTETENVYFYKVFFEDKLIAAIHCELYDSILYLAVAVFPEYQNMGFGTSALRSTQRGCLDIVFNKIHVSIEVHNIASLRLFEKVGFHCTGKDEELFEYEYTVV